MILNIIAKGKLVTVVNVNYIPREGDIIRLGMPTTESCGETCKVGYVEKYIVKHVDFFTDLCEPTRGMEATIELEVN